MKSAVTYRNVKIQQQREEVDDEQLIKVSVL